MRRALKFTPFPAAEPQEPTATINTGDDMNWLQKLLSLIPLIAFGANQIHSDINSKQALAADSLELAIAGAKALAPAEHQGLIDTIAPIAKTALTATVAAMHNASQPAAAPASA